MALIANKHDFENRLALVAREQKMTKEQVRAVVRAMHPSTSAYVLSALAQVPIGKIFTQPADIPV